MSAHRYATHCMKHALPLLITSLTLFFSPNQARGQQPVKIQRLSAPVEFDGRPFEEAWNGLEYFTMVQNRPNFGQQPTERSEVMIAYDDQYVWIGARLYMQDASKIVAASKKRDEYSRNSDSFGVLFDTYNDNENALGFYTMPTGLRLDYTVANDGVMNMSGGGGGGGGGGGMAMMGSIGGMNTSWNTFWDVQTTRDDRGWYVEMRIPFSSLRFKPENDVAVMGLIITRTISYNSETDTYPAIDPKYSTFTTGKPSLAADIEFQGAKPSRPVYISPYVTGGYTDLYNPNNEGTAYINDTKYKFDAGLDVKYNINSNLTLDLTVNTDFAQVEADNQQVNLTRYSLFFPEKRQFFQERSSLFSYSLGGSSNLFYSRDIGLSRSGEPVRIYGGARLVGRIGEWDLGMIDMQTEEFDGVPSENFGVFRMRRQVINDNSYVGGIFTSRLGMNGDHNFAYGLDGIFRVFGVDYLDVKVAQTYDSKIDNKINTLDPMFISANWERRSEEGFAYQLGYSYSGQEFNPGVGFVQRGGLQGFSGNLMYGWMPGPQSKLFNYAGSVRFSRYTRLQDGELESLSVEPGWEVNLKTGYRAEISVGYSREGVGFTYNLSDSVKVFAGDYEFTNLSLRLVTPMTKPLSFVVNANTGGFYDGYRTGISVVPSLNIGSSLQLTGSYSFNHITFPDRETNNKLNIHSGGARATYMLNTKLSASVFVQYTNTSGDFVSNFRLRFNPREGNDFYLVVNGSRGITNKIFNPEFELPVYYDRSIILKYTHTFIL